jgi:hypothetical protein
MEARSETDIQIADQLLADDPAALSQVLASYCPDIQRVLRTGYRRCTLPGVVAALVRASPVRSSGGIVA